MNEVYPQSVSAVRNDLCVGVRHSLTRKTLWKMMVMRNVCIGLTFGRTANEVSPTNPLDEDDTPEALTEKLAPKRWASTITAYQTWVRREIACIH